MIQKNWGISLNMLGIAHIVTENESYMFSNYLIIRLNLLMPDWYFFCT